VQARRSRANPVSCDFVPPSRVDSRVVSARQDFVDGADKAPRCRRRRSTAHSASPPPKSAQVDGSGTAVKFSATRVGW